ncbi:MAG: hypothetical protein ACI4KB_08270 [Oscillospiraceae bacterium]
MENVMTNGFAELSANEMETVNGGVNGEYIAAGAGVVVTCLGVAVAAAAAPIALSVLASGALVALSGIGGYTIGYGIVH